MADTRLLHVPSPQGSAGPRRSSAISIILQQGRALAAEPWPTLLLQAHTAAGVQQILPHQLHEVIALRNICTQSASRHRLKRRKVVASCAAHWHCGHHAKSAASPAGALGGRCQDASSRTWHKEPVTTVNLPEEGSESTIVNDCATGIAVPLQKVARHFIAFFTHVQSTSASISSVLRAYMRRFWRELGNGQHICAWTAAAQLCHGK